MSKTTVFRGFVLTAALALTVLAAPLAAQISAGIGDGVAPGIAGGPAPTPGGGIAPAPAPEPTPEPTPAPNPAPAPAPGPVIGGGTPPPLPAPPPLVPTPPAQGGIAPHFVAVNGQPTGPFAEADLRAMVARGELKRDTLVWAEGMADWVAAEKVVALQPLFASLPPEVKFDPNRYLTGTWRSDPINTQLEGFSSATIQATATYASGGALRIYGTINGMSVYGQQMTFTLSGEGSFTAAMQGADTIVVTPLVMISYSSQMGPAGGETMSTPFLVKIIDSNTVADDQGNRSYRLP
ncbi:DUF4339 domain-containing protein [Pseudotabrizicola sp. L79]|uniref:DUF4339 domain-containing protein n=1 Tax=Pseudotabrizicola sp. L79 TaxID=3118402 RepID=UPI002F9283F5